jgi:hypothetical protein
MSFYSLSTQQAHLEKSIVLSINDLVMNEHNRIPDRRPILFELFCPKCGGSVYAIDEEEFYIGRNEHAQSPFGYTITKLECVLCREIFDVKGIGLKYEEEVAKELGWPFPVQIPSGPNAVPAHVERRMRKREQEPDPRGDMIDDFLADRYNRSPSLLEKNVLRYILKRKGHLARTAAPAQEIAVSDDEGAYNAQIIGASIKSGLSRRQLFRRIRVSDCDEGDIIESVAKNRDGSTEFIYYTAFNGTFQPIAVAAKRALKAKDVS